MLAYRSGKMTMFGPRADAVTFTIHRNACHSHHKFFNQ